MKTKCLITVCFIILQSAFCLSSLAQGTAFTYQGRLNNASAAANGSYDFLFTLYDAATGTNIVGGPQLITGVLASNGLFTATIDFGGAFSGADRWLEIFVRTNAGPVFTPLVPRQQLTPTPYAITAGKVISGGLAAGTYGSAVNFSNASNYFSGAFNGNGAGVTNANAGTLNGLTSAGFWRTNGNAGANPANGAFLGTADNQPLEFKVNGQRALRLEPDNNYGAPNVIGGSAVNFVGPGVAGAVIGGGGAMSYFGTGASNSVMANFGTIGGGVRNQIQPGADDSTIGGGFRNQIHTNANFSTIGGGYINQIQPDAYYSMIGGGEGNQIQGGAYESTIGGGDSNEIQPDSPDATIGGGYSNQIQHNDGASTISGGYENVMQSSAYSSTISGGSQNQIQTNAYYSTISGGVANFSSGYASTVGGGSNNVSGYNFATVGGGFQNFASGNGNGTGDSATVAGGWRNEALGNNATVAGGYRNLASGDNAAVCGGGLNVASGRSSFASGENTRANGDFSVAMGQATRASGYNATAIGNSTIASDEYAAAFGYQARATNRGTFVWADASSLTPFTSTSSNQFLVRASGGVGIGTPAPGTSLHVSGYESRLRLQSTNSASYAATEYVTDNHVWHTGVGGSAVFNQLYGKYYIFDGNVAKNRVVIDTAGNVGIGTDTPAAQTTISGNFSGNQSLGLHVLGTGSGGAGLCLEQQGVYSWALGMEPLASRLGFFSNRFPGHGGTEVLSIAANGNVGIGTTSPDALLSVNGSADKPGGGSWGTFSDARLKDVGVNFTHGLAALADIQPVHYHYKSDNPLQLPSQPEYVGVVAQEVQAAIPEAVHQNRDGYLVVNNDPILWTMFNAIKELDQKREAEMKEKDAKIQSLEKRLDELQALMKQLAHRSSETASLAN